MSSSLDKSLPSPVSVLGRSLNEGLRTLEEARAFVRDVIALSTLPAIWMGANHDRIGESLLAVLQTTLRPAISYIRIPPLIEGETEALEVAYVDGEQASTEQIDGIRKAICQWAAQSDPDDILHLPISHKVLRVCRYSLGFDAGAGVLAVGFEYTGEGRLSPTALERTLLNIASNQAITACRNAALQRQAETARAEVQTQYEFSRALSAELDVQTILQKTTDAVTVLTGAKFGAFFHNVVGVDQESYRLYTLSGACRETFAELGMPRNTPLFEHTFQGKAPLRIDDVLRDYRYGKVAPHFGLPQGHLPVRSYLAVPVVPRTGEVLGGLFLGHPEPSVFGERAERVALGVATQAAIALEHARLFERVGRELAQRRQMEQQLREGERRKDEFLATLSHELRNPLAPIRTAASVLATTERDPEAIRAAAAIIARQSSHLTRLVDDLLDVSRISCGKIELRKQHVDVASLIQEALEAVQPLCDQRTLELCVSLPEQTIFIEADPVRIVQVIGNLLHNACKYSVHGGTVRLNIERQGDQCLIRVRDHGSGIPPDELSRIFDLFSQVEPSNSRAPGGLGIGLSLARSLAEMHGGGIEARSDGLGQGSEFVVRLPTASLDVERDEGHVTAATSLAPEQRTLRIVAVDDYADSLECTSIFLQLQGHEVYTAQDGEQALQVIDAQRPHVVLLDIGLPGMDGYEVARQIRSQPWGSGMLLVAMTGWGHEQDKQRAVDAGFNAHLTKPADPVLLERLLQDLSRAP